MSRIHRAQAPPNIEKEGIDISPINDFRNFRHSHELKIHLGK